MSTVPYGRCALPQACNCVKCARKLAARSWRHCHVQQYMQYIQCCFTIGWQSFPHLFMSLSRPLLQDTINGLAGCLLRAKDDMTSPSGKRLVRAASVQPCTYLDVEHNVMSDAMRQWVLNGLNHCPHLPQLELIVEARSLKKTLGFLQPELLAEYAKQVTFRRQISALLLPVLRSSLRMVALTASDCHIVEVHS
jgi:hypothetical protein